MKKKGERDNGIFGCNSVLLIRVPDAVAETEASHRAHLADKDAEMVSMKAQYDDRERQHHVHTTKLQIDVSDVHFFVFFSFLFLHCFSAVLLF